MNDRDAAKQLRDLQDRAARLYEKMLRLAEMMENVAALAAVRGKVLVMLEDLEKDTRRLEMSPGAKLSVQQECVISELAKTCTEMEQSVSFFLRLLGDPKA
jgi:hypothetical protein